MVELGQELDLGRCPHCGVAKPLISMAWRTQIPYPRKDGAPASFWAAYFCSTCGSMIAAKGQPGNGNPSAHVVETIPAIREAHVDIPEPARRFLQQAFETLHAPDAAALMAGSAVDAMLKKLGLKEGSLYARIDQAVEKQILTASMGEWAHEVRLGSNRPRHADDEKPHVSPDEARQAVDFAEALAQFLFVLSAKIARGIEQAKAASG